ncbi:hypothetical protein LMG33818_001806 [Halomonadaceae bacterium LMG 33818]|uniref:Rid family hydrolase n=1 Tax=Cernens ardua TaxID=3402176 RepID=UPI003EDBC12D
MTTLIKATTGSKFERGASYSRVVCVDDWIYVSNTAGRNPVTKEISDDLNEQIAQVFINVETALKGVGASLQDAIAIRLFIQNPDDVPAVMEVIGAEFNGIDPAMTATCPPLGSTVYKFEMEVTAYRGAGQAETKRVQLGR